MVIWLYGNIVIWLKVTRLQWNVQMIRCLFGCIIMCMFEFTSDVTNATNTQRIV